MTDVDEPIELRPYDARWPQMFASEMQRVALVLPEDVRIEHIGSTAVPGLLAKPVIDLMAGIAAWHDLADVRTALVGLGYEDMGEAGVPGRIYLRRRDVSAFNLALVARDGLHWNPNLALRNYLRANPEAAREYAQVKCAAWESGIRSRLAYSAYKDAVVRRLVRQALNAASACEA